MSAVGKVIQVIGQAVLHSIDGSTRMIYPGDIISLGDVIETTTGSKVVLQLASGREIVVGANEQVAIDETLISAFDDAVVNADELQQMLESGEDLSDSQEETAAGEEAGQNISLGDYLSGDSSEGYVGSYLLPSAYVAPASETNNPGTGTTNNNTQTTETTDGTITYSLAEGATVPPGFVLNPDGSYFIDPSIPDYDYLGEGETAEYNVDVIVTYPDGYTEPGVINVVIEGTNDAPVAYAAVIDAVEDGTVVTGQLQANDPDVNDVLTYAAVSQDTPAGFTLNPDGSYSFDPASYGYLAQGQTATFSVTYSVTDDKGAVDYNTITITVTGTNDAPVVSDITYSGTEDTPVIITAEQLLAQASDVDGDTLSIVSVDSVSGGTLTDNGNGTYTFTPDRDYSGQAVFTFTVTDGTATSSATGRIDIAAVNDAPVAEAAANAVTEGNIISGQLTATDVEGDILTFSTNGELPAGFVLNPNGSYSFDASSYGYLAEGQQAVYDITYTVSDGNGGTSVSTLTITVTGTNDAPVAEAAAASVVEDNTITGQLTATDADSTVLTFAAVGDTPAGFTLNPDGSYTFDASSYSYLTEGQQAVYEIPYTVTDELGATSTAKLTITVTGTNDAPVAEAAAASVVEDNTITGQLTATDPDSTGLTFSVSEPPAGFTLNPDGSYSFDASSYDYLGEGEQTVVEIPYTVTDEFGAASTAKLSITVTGTNDAAVVSADSVVLTEADAPLTANGQLTITDVDNPAVFIAQTDTEGAYGKFSIDANGAWTFVANSAFNELNVGDSYSEKFTVAAADGTTSTVTVRINGTNDAAVLSSESVILTESDVALTTNGQLTITDVDNPAVFIAQTDTEGTYGKFSIDENGAWTFTANSAFNELNVGDSYTETFTVSAEDGTTSTVTVRINGTNDAAVLSSESVTLTELDVALTANGQLTITDVDNPSVFVAQTDTEGTYGKFSIDENGAWTFTANSAFNELNIGDSYSETFTVSAADGTTSTVTVRINGTNDAAVLASESVTLTESDVALTANGQITITDVDNPAVFVAQTDTEGTYGKFSIDANGAWTFTANSAFNELNVGDSYSETFTVSAADGTTSAVTVRINGTNDAAILSSESVTLTETDTALTANGQLTITDVDNPAVFVAQTDTEGTYGKFSIDANGAWTFTANSAFNELNVGDSYSETFTVAAADGTTSTVTVRINGTNDAAVVSSESVVLTESDTALSANGQLTITDVDNPAVFVAQTDTEGTYGKFSIDENGAWTFTANSAFNELNVGDSYTETFTVSAEDGTTSTVTVRINGTNDAAILSSESVTLTESDTALTANGQLTITDVDNPAVFVAQTDTEGTYGKFSIDANGAWTFVATSAFNELNVGDSYSETFTVSAADGTTSTVTVRINGTNDAAVVSSESVVLTESDTALTANGQLTITDVDNPAVFVAQTDTEGTYGKFSIDENGAWTFTANSAFNELNVGDSYSETFTVAAADGTTSTVTVRINGTNDAAVLSSESVVLTETDIALTANGQLTITDVDNPAVFVAQTDTEGTYGKFSIDENGAWTFVANSAFNELNVGDSYSETFTVSAADGTTSTVTVRINGTNDAAVLSSESVTLTESDTALTANGQLTITDVDNPAVFVAQTDTEGIYGKFSIDENGAWTFTANSAFNELNVGDSYSETFTVEAADGTTSTVTVRINGTNDAAVLSSESVVLTESDTALTANGQLTITDVDNPAVFVAQTDTEGTYGKFSIDENGAWTFTANSAFNELNVGDSYSETFTVAAADGTTSTVTVRINGTNDAAILSSESVVLTETDTALTANGQLTITDVDNPAVFVAQTDTEGTYGKFSIDENGAWTFVANSAFNELNVGDSYAETFTVSAADGTTSTVTVKINGTNDAAVIEAETVTLYETNSILTTGGRLDITDVDSAASFVAQTNTAGQYGKFSIDADGNWTFTANSTYNNLPAGQQIQDVFEVAAADGTRSSVTVNIIGTNDAPFTSGATVNVSENGNKVSGTLTASDYDKPDTLTFSLVDNQTLPSGFTFDPSNGKYSMSAAQGYDYLAAGQSVSYKVYYKVTDSQGASTVGTINITVNGTADAPVISAVNNETAVNFVSDGGSYTNALGVYTVDAEGNPVAGELILLNSDRTAANELLATYQGTDVKFFIVTNVGSSFTGGTVSFDNSGTYPVLKLNGQTVSNNVFFSDTSLNSDGLDHFIEKADGTVGVEDLKYGTSGYDGDFNDLVFKVTTQNAVYTENDGPTSIASDVSISDVDSTTMSKMVISITSPKAGDVLTVGELPAGITATVSGTQVTLTGAASADAYEQALKAVLFHSTSENPDTTAREFSVVVTDESGTVSAPALITMQVVSVNDNPVANDDTATVDENSSVVIDVRSNDTDLDGDTLSVSAVSQPAHGTVTIGADGKLVYTPTRGYYGTDSFTYTVSDGKGGTDTATVSITVNYDNIAPVVSISSQSVTFTEHGSAISVALGTVITDPDNTTMKGATIQIENPLSGDKLSIGALTGLGITAVLSADGTTVTLTGESSTANYQKAIELIRFSTDSQDDADRSVKVVVTDGAENSNTVITTVHVVVIDDAPVAASNTAAVTEINPVVITGDAEVTKVTVGTDINQDVTPAKLGYTTPTVYNTVAMNQNVTVNSSYAVIKEVPAGINANVNGDTGNGYVEIVNVGANSTVNVNIGGGNDVVYLSGNINGYVNVNGDAGYDVLILPGTASDYRVVNNGGVMSIYSTNSSWTGTIVANNIEEIRYGGYSSASYEYVVDVETSRTLSEDGYVVLAVANGKLSAGIDNRDGTWTVQAEDIEGLKIIPTGSGEPDVALVSVTDPQVVTDISASVTTGNVITDTDAVYGKDYDSDTAVSDLHISKVGDTAVAANGETAVQGTYGTLYIKADGSYRYELDNDGTSLDNVNKGDVVKEEFTYSLTDGTSVSTAKLIVSINGADDVSVSAGSLVINEGTTSVPVANLMFMIDVSKSMDEIITSTKDSRLTVLKDALVELIEKYDSKGDIGGIQIVKFSTDATALSKNGSTWLSVADAKSFILALKSDMYTDYDDALAKLEEIYKASTPPSADYTHVYFVSDGAPTKGEEVDANDLTKWRTWLTSSPVDEVYSVGIGSGTDSAQLKVVAWSAENQNYMDNVLVVPDDTLEADIAAAAEKNSRESSVFNDVDLPDGITAHLTAVTFAGHRYEFSDAVTEHTISLGDNGSVVIHADGTVVFTAGTDVPEDITSLLKYTFEANDQDYAGTLSLTSNHVVDTLVDLSLSAGSGYRVVESANGYGVDTGTSSTSDDGIAKGEKLTFSLGEEVDKATFNITGTVTTSSTWTAYDDTGAQVGTGTLTSGKFTIDTAGDFSSVVFSGGSTNGANFYVAPVSATGHVDGDNVFSVLDSGSSLDFSKLSDLDGLQLANHSKVQSITLSAQDVLNISDTTTHNLQITGGSEDTVVLSGDWTKSGTNTYTSSVNGIDVSIEINNEQHKIKVDYTDQGD
ncbi:retention module-containing protein [Seleniivibrio woodruffii]|uniref:retention module-containing protein n=1 Tax=Seleniivibrio woodruffii TaxID=1078050 RepID=UPI0024091E74|nr:retention module-containing protein [Seleniivibrio woodruffii]